MKGLFIPLLAAAFAALAPGGAAAAVVQSQPGAGGGRTLAFVDDVGEPNAVTIGRDDGFVVFHDAAAQVDAGAGCAALDGQTATCPSRGVATVDVSGGEGDDLIDDNLPSYPGTPVRYAELHGGAGDDQLLGSSVDEGFDGGTGADNIAGGRGTDSATEAGPNGEPVTVILDALPNDGTPGEADNIRAVEYLIGSPGDDVLIGNGYDNHIYGGGGNDRIAGRGGRDDLAGGDGADLLDGGTGRDQIDASDPHGPGPRPDSVFCGTSWDVASGDRQDGYAADCEQYAFDGRMHLHAPTKASGRPPGLPALVAPSAIVRKRSLVVIAGCAETAGCSGTVLLQVTVPRSGAAARKLRKIGRARFRASAGQFVLVKLKLSASKRRALRRVRRGTATVTARGQYGGVRVTRRRVRLH